MSALQHQITEVVVSDPKVPQPLTLSLVADLHNGPYQDLLPVFRRSDAILVAGDLIDRHHPGHGYAAGFLRDAPACAPTFYALGNHEIKYRQMDEYWPLVMQSQVQVLDNSRISFRGIVLGALSAAIHNKADGRVVPEMEKQPGFKLLICHHPEYYAPFVKGHGIDLTVSGHVHGGQIQIHGRGLYAPGQGLLPRLTNGLYEDGHLLVSRGLTNSVWVPRFGNPCELVLVHLQPGPRWEATLAGDSTLR